MWKWIRVGIVGVLIGLLGGMLYIEMGAIRRLYGVGQALEQMMEAAETDTGAFDITDVYGQTDGLKSETLNQMETVFQTLDAETTEEMGGDEAASDVIRLQVIYDGAEELTEKEEQTLATCVEQAALFCIADKLGEDYDEMEKEEVRKKLIMNMERINACAAEAAEEYGVEVTASSRFEYVSLPEAEVGGTMYPAGYYETLCITLGE